MKTSTVMRHIVAALTATQALGKGFTKNEGFEVRVRNVSASSDEASAQATTTALPEATTAATGMTMDMLDLSDDSKFAVSNDSDVSSARAWEIPVSHSACTGWALRTTDLTDAIRNLINWSNRGNRLLGKSVHYEIAGGTGAYACNCKLTYEDELPERELAEFYERLTLWCGHGRSGWIFSKKWEKGFAVDAMFAVVTKRPARGLCPPFCVHRNI